METETPGSTYKLYLKFISKKAVGYSITLNREIQKRLYSELLRIRITEEVLVGAYCDQEMRCPVHFSIGQEAVAVGVCQALSGCDTVMSGHRSHAHYLAKGGNLKSMVAELYGKSTGCASGKGGSMHLIDLTANFLGATSIVAGTMPVAVGVGFANKLKNKESVSVIFFGDGATEEGLFYESLNFAALHKLPVLFVCENNLYSVYSPLSVRQPRSRKIYKVAMAMGINSVKINGNDVEKVYLNTKKALDIIRLKKGPYFIEAMTYRWLEHCGPNYDNSLGYRTEKEFLKWKENDPVVTYQQRLLKRAIISDEFIEALRHKIRREIKDAFDHAKSSSFPAPDRLTEDVYAS